MKKQFLLLVLLAAFSNMDAQILYSNTFDGGITGMTVMDMDNNEPHANVSEFAGTWSSLSATRFDEYPDNAAISSSYYSPVGQSDDWLITPAINIPTGSVMTWDAISLDKQFKDSYEVLISTTDNDPSSFKDVVFKVDEEEDVLTTRTINLNDYVGETIYIAFRNVSKDKFLLVIDNIFVRLPYERDVFVKSIDLELNPVNALNTKTTLFGKKRIKANLLNFGSDRITSIKIAYTLNGQKLEETLSSNFHSGETMTFESEEIHIPIGDGQLLDVDVLSVNGMSDQDDTNDRRAEVFDVKPSVPVFTFNDSKGRSVNLHNLLRSGKSVLLNFFNSDCSDCEASFEKLNQYYLATGAGNDDLEIISIAMSPEDTNGTLNNLGWSATFPLVQYSPYNELMWVHFTKSLGLDLQAEAPFFVQICPAPVNPAFSSISASSGFTTPSVFENDFRPQHTACQTGVSAVSEIEIIDDMNIYPNPNFTGEVNIDLELKEQAKMQLQISNTQGQIVKEMGVLSLNAGNNYLKYDISDLESGLYFINFVKDNQVSYYKMSIIK